MCYFTSAIAVDVGWLDTDMQLPLQDKAVGNPAVKTVLTLLLRFGNTYSGGLQWMW